MLRLGPVREFALLTLDRLLADAWDGAETLHHVIAYGDDSGNRCSVRRLPGRSTIMH